MLQISPTCSEKIRCHFQPYKFVETIPEQNISPSSRFFPRKERYEIFDSKIFARKFDEKIKFFTRFCSHKNRPNKQLNALGTFCTSIIHNHYIPISTVGVGKERHINWSMAIPEKAAPITGTTLRTTGPVPADSRQ